MDSDVVENQLQPVRICLYVAIPEDQQDRRAGHPAWRRWRSRTRLALAGAASRLTGGFNHSDYHYRVANDLTDNSNRGDIGIRMAVRDQLAAAFAPRPVSFMELAWGQLDDRAVDEINASCDLFVIGGGGYVFIFADGSLGRALADPGMLSKLRCPVLGFGVGLNRLMNEGVCDLTALPPETMEKVKALGECCRYLSVRDRDTLDMFHLCGTRHAVLTGDPALFLGGWTPKARNRDGRMSVGLNFAAHGWRAISVLEPLLPVVADFLTDMQRRHDVAFTYLLHHDFERPVAAYLQRRGFKLDVVDGSSLDLVAAYSRMDAVVCQMLHATIFAANAGVPFLNIAYDRKNVAFCDLMGIPDVCVPHDQATASVLTSTFDRLLTRRTEIVETMRVNKASLEIAQKQFLGSFIREIPIGAAASVDAGAA